MLFKLARALFVIGLIMLAVSCGGEGDAGSQADALLNDAAAGVEGNSTLTPSLSASLDQQSGYLRPVITALWWDSLPHGEGRIVENAIDFSGTSEPYHIVELWLNDELAGSTIANRAGEWRFYYTSVSLNPGAYDARVISVSRENTRVAAADVFQFRYDLSVPETPSVRSISTDSHGPSDGYTNDGTLLFSGNMVYEPGLVVTVFMDGVDIGGAVVQEDGTWYFDHSSVDLSDAGYAVTAQASVLGLVSAMSPPFQLVVDRSNPIPPNLSGISEDTGSNGSDGITNDNQLIFNGTAEPHASVRLRIDTVVVGTATADANGNWQLDYQSSILSMGSYNVELEATDRAGNRSDWSSPIPIRIDTVAPDPVLNLVVEPDTGLMGDGITATGALQIRGLAEVGATVYVFANNTVVGSALVDGGADWLVDLSSTPIADGTYGITAQVEDVAGNRSALSAPVNIVVDSQDPAIPAITEINSDTGTLGDGVTSDNTLVISGVAEAGSSVEIYVDTVSVGTSAADGSGVWLFDYTSTTLADGSHTITATATDVTGNTSGNSSVFDLTVDTNDPDVMTLVPMNGATDVAMSSGVSIEFNESIFESVGSFRLRRTADNSLVEAVDVSDAAVDAVTNTVSVGFSNVLHGGTQYFVELDANSYADLAGNRFNGIAGNATWVFTTEDTALVNAVPADQAINVALDNSLVLTFNEPVIANSGDIRIRRSVDDAIVDTIDINSGQVVGSGSANLVISQSGVLEPNTAYYVELDPGALVNGNNVSYSGFIGNTFLRFSTANVAVPTITNVTSSTADGNYSGNDTILIEIEFSEIVNVTGAPQLLMDLDSADRYINYLGGSGTNQLQFEFMVATGDTKVDLDYAATDSLVLNGGSIRSQNNANATLDLPAPGMAASLSGNKNINITAAALDISSLTPSDGFLIEGSETSLLSFGHSISSGGDFNGDGFADLVIGAPTSNLDSSESGAAWLVWGASGATRSTLNMAGFSAGDGLTIAGAVTGDHLGSVVDLSGDLNGDGYDDLVVVSSRQDAGDGDAGSVYVVWGEATPGNVNVATDFNTAVGFTNSNGFVVLGAEPVDELGHYSTTDPNNAQFLDTGGDFNGDGINDLIIGHNQSDFNGQNNVGVAYVVLGKTGVSRANFKLDSYATEGFAIYHSATSNSYVGHSVQYIGDFNGDGYNDVIIGAPQSDGGAVDSGEAYVVFGHAGPTFTDLDLATLNGVNGFVISTANGSGLLGGSVSSADLNGDGLTDLIIGVSQADTGVNTDNGAAMVIYGNVNATYNNISLESLGTAGYLIHGERSNDRSGYAVRGIGDVNGDGIADMVISSVDDAEGGLSAGAAWVIYGESGTGRADIELESLTGAVGFKIIGDQAGDMLGGSITSSDLNGDGYSDLIMSSVAGDNNGADTGEVNVIWGQDFTSSVFSGNTGSSNVDHLVGTSNADVMVGNGGADTISSGSGDDTLVVPDFTFAAINGGRGRDVLQLTASGVGFDLRNVPYDKMQGIEVIDLGSGGNILTLDKISLLKLNGEARSLYVNGAINSAVILDANETWTLAGSVTIGLLTYNQYELDSVSLFVASDIVQPLTPPAPSVNAISIDTATAGDAVTSDNQLVVSGISGAFETIEIFINGVSVGTATATIAGTWFYDHSGVTLSDGVYSVTAQATNLGGYTSALSSVLAVTVDTAIPNTPTIQTISNDTGIIGDAITSDDTLIFIGSSDSSMTIELFVDDVSIGTTSSDGVGNWSYDYSATPLADGVYTLTANAVDQAGNVSALSSGFDVVIDRGLPSPPSITGISGDSGANDGITNDNTLNINGAGEVGALVTVLMGGSSIGTTTVTGAGTWVLNYSTTVLADGAYQLTATQSDSAGNVSSVSSPYDITVDTSAPIILSTTPADGGSNIGLSDPLTLIFDEAVITNTGNISIRRVSDDVLFETIPINDPRVTGAGTNTITIDPAGIFSGGVDYYVQIDASALSNVSGTGFAGISNTTDWNFSVVPTQIIISTPSDNATGVALNTDINMTFNESVTANSGNIYIRKTSDNSIWDTIAVGSPQVTGSGSPSINVTLSDVLEPGTDYYVTIDPGTFVNGVGVSYSGISVTTDFSFTSISAAIPTVVDVTSSNADGTYGVGDTIAVEVQFSEAVNVTLGVPQLTLDLDVIDVILAYASGSGSDTLTFQYPVVLGDASADLDYIASSALSLNSARIRSLNYVDADLTLANPGAPGSLASNKNIVIDTGLLDVSNLTSAHGFMVDSDQANAGLGVSVSRVGDVNGDGFEDFIAGAPAENGGRGAAYVIYGQPGASRSNLVTSSISNGVNGFRIYSNTAGDKLGMAAGGAGDFNHDGYGDVYVIASGASDYATNAGVLYIVYGKSSNTDIDIGSFSSIDGIVVHSAEAGALMGESSDLTSTNGQTVDSGGDYNGDGIDDIVLGLPSSDEGGNNSGKAYVLFGQKTSSLSTIDLDLISSSGPQGMLIGGATANSELGQSVGFIGDFNVDGYDDVAVSGWLSDDLVSDGGQAFVLYGKPGPYFASLDVSSLNASDGVKIVSSEVGGKLGHSVAGGDFNGDGISDLMVSHHGFNTETGQAHVVYGSAGAIPGTIDVDTMLSNVGYGIAGVATGDRTGSSIANAGDFNADGIDDILVSAYWHDGDGSDSGAAWLVTGQAGTTRADILLGSLDIADGIKIVGDQAGDHLGQGVASADVNGDGFSDLIAAAPQGDNGASDAGEAIVLWGQEFHSMNNYGLVGDSGVDNLVGSSGSEILSGGGGADAICAGAGDDVLEVSDTSFFRIDGGLGNDTLRMNTTAANLNIASLGPEVIKSVEVIDLGDSGNSLTLSKSSVAALSENTSSLFVRGGSSDTVNSSAGDAWVSTGIQNISGVDYEIYLDEAVTLYIETGINTGTLGSFQSSQQYTFDTTASGANVTGDVVDFPVLIRISSAIQSTLQLDYDDIRFSDADGISWLPFEIEPGATGEIYAWVLVPQVDGNSNSDYIVMHYNDRINGDVPNGEDPASLWKDYAGVWHFDEGSSGTAYDSSAYQNHAAEISSTVSVNTNKLIGHGRDFQGGDRLQVPYDIALNVDNRPFTIEAWVREDVVITLIANLASTWMSRGSGDFSWELIGKAGILTFISAPEFSITESLFSSTTRSFNGGGFILSGSSWLYTTLVVDPATGVTIYGDGVKMGSTGLYRNSEDGSAFLMGGSNCDQQMDEIRYGRFVSDANRIKLNYENQKLSSSLVSPQF